jgi:hypothetical protein
MSIKNPPGLGLSKKNPLSDHCAEKNLYAQLVFLVPPCAPVDDNRHKLWT